MNRMERARGEGTPGCRPILRRRRSPGSAPGWGLTGLPERVPRPPRPGDSSQTSSHSTRKWKEKQRQSVGRSDPLPIASTAPLGARCHAAHAGASPRPSTDESPRNPQVCTTLRVGVRRPNWSSSTGFHCLLLYHLARRPHHAIGTTDSSLERCVFPPDTGPWQKRVLLAAAAHQPPGPRRMGMRWPLHLPWHARQPAWLPTSCTPSFGPPPKPPEPLAAMTHGRSARCWLLLLASHLALGAM